MCKLPDSLIALSGLIVKLSYNKLPLHDTNHDNVDESLSDCTDTVELISDGSFMLMYDVVVL